MSWVEGAVASFEDLGRVPILVSETEVGTSVHDAPARSDLDHIVADGDARGRADGSTP